MKTSYMYHISQIIYLDHIYNFKATPVFPTQDYIVQLLCNCSLKNCNTVQWNSIANLVISRFASKSNINRFQHPDVDIVSSVADPGISDRDGDTVEGLVLS